MQLAAVSCTCEDDGKALRVGWNSSRSRVAAVTFRSGAATRSVPVAAGKLIAEVPPRTFPRGAQVDVTAQYTGAPVRLLTGESADRVPPSTKEQFDRRSLVVHQTKDGLRRHRLLFLEMDRRTHLDLLDRLQLPAADETRLRGAIERLAKWLWRTTLRRAAAYARDLDPRVERWAGFDEDVVLVSRILCEVFAPYLDIADDAFERFANGELTIPGLTEHGGPDGAYYTSFAGFARLASRTSAVPDAERTFWRARSRCFVATLEIFEACYRAPVGERARRQVDFATWFHKAPVFTAATKAELRGRFAAMDEQALDDACDRWVARMFSEDVIDLGG